MIRGFFRLIGLLLLAGGFISAAAAGVIGLLLARRRGIGARDYLRPAALARMVA